MTTAAPVSESSRDDAIAEQAADWLIRLAGEDIGAGECAAFEAWKRSDVRHAEAAERMAGLIERIQGLRATMGGMRPARAALKAAGADKGKRSPMRRTAATIALLLTLVVPGWLASRAYPPAYLLAGLRSPLGVPIDRQLPDDSHIALRGSSAVNLHFDGRKRAVELVRGAILVDVAPDAERPFLVQTDHGTIQALGTRFAVRRDDRSTVLTMLESSVVVEAPPGVAGDGRQIVHAGQQVRIDADGVGAAERIDASDVEAAWTANQLVIREAPLPDVLDELAKQRVGIIHYDRGSLADIKVSAVLPLGNTDKALRLLASSLNLRIDMPLPGITIVARAGPKSRDQ